MPDLVYDPATPGSFGEAWRKCYYGRNYFSALFSGKSLQPGKYRIVVTLREAGREKTSSRDVTIADVPEKICARFFPSEHFDFVRNFAAPKGYRVYTDPFVGYWSSSGGNYWKEPLPPNARKTIEIPLKLSECEAIEYSTGMLRTILYNVNKTCATNSLEIGQLQHLQDMDRADRIAFYYYKYNPAGPCIEPQASENLEFGKLQHGDRLEPVRLDTVDQRAVHNSLDLRVPIEPIPLKAFKRWNMKGNDRRYVALYGVVTPIRNKPDEVTRNPLDGKFSVRRRIESVSYDISVSSPSAGTVLISPDVVVSTDLARIFRNGRTDTSIYEYRHVFDLSGLKEKKPEWIQFDMIGRDGDGNFVEGTRDLIVLLM